MYIYLYKVLKYKFYTLVGGREEMSRPIKLLQYVYCESFKTHSFLMKTSKQKTHRGKLPPHKRKQTKPISSGFLLFHKFRS